MLTRDWIQFVPQGAAKQVQGIIILCYVPEYCAVLEADKLGKESARLDQP